MRKIVLFHPARGDHGLHEVRFSHDWKGKTRAKMSILFAKQTPARQTSWYYLGRFAPYLDLPCLRSFTAAQSRVPRTMW